MKFTFLGTGDARQIPVYGCECEACQRAQSHTRHRRGPCSAMMTSDSGQQLLLDAGLPDLRDRFPPGTINTILLTHYHMDHVAGLFPLRWGVGQSIAVYGPDDPQGCDDLYKHPGILDFKAPLRAFEPLTLGPWQITPLPLNHSRPTLGYCIRHGNYSLAYLTDTVGLPPETMAFLQRHCPDDLILDCTHAPSNSIPRNHNNWDLALKMARDIAAERVWLTHIGHEMETWLMHHQLPDGIQAARDQLTLERTESLT